MQEQRNSQLTYDFISSKRDLYALHITSAITLPGIVDNDMRAFTIEFWFKSIIFPPTSLSLFETCSSGFLPDATPCQHVFVKASNI